MGFPPTQVRQVRHWRTERTEWTEWAESGSDGGHSIESDSYRVWRLVRAVVGLGSLVASGVGARRLLSLTHCLVNGADSGGWFVSRRKTQVRGRSNRAIAARRKVCLAHEGKLKRDRGDPESNGLVDLIITKLS